MNCNVGNDTLLTHCAGSSQDGSSEEVLGQWLEARGIRDQMVIATKVSSDTKG